MSVVVDDLEAAISFFVELGMKLEGAAPIEGDWVDRVNGLDGVRVDIAMLRDPDGHGGLELTKFHTPAAVRAEPENTLGLRSVMFTVEDIDATVAGLRSRGPEGVSVASAAGRGAAMSGRDPSTPSSSVTFGDRVSASGRR